MLRNSAERGARANVEPLVERQNLERLICRHYQWAIETCRVDPNLVVANGFEHQGHLLRAQNEGVKSHDSVATIRRLWIWLPGFVRHFENGLQCPIDTRVQVDDLLPSESSAAKVLACGFIDVVQLAEEVQRRK
jgi:hypothetical protein